MTNEYYGVASTPTEDFLAHYGVKGMKWGVRRALDHNSEKTLSKHYAKAQKKLAKLEKRAAKTKSYAKRAKAQAAGAALAGTVAGLGASKVASGAVKAAGAVTKGAGYATMGAGRLLSKMGKHNAAMNLVKAGGNALQTGVNLQHVTSGHVSDAVNKWGRGTNLSDEARKRIGSMYEAASKGSNNIAKSTARSGLKSANNALKGVSNDTIARVGAGILGAGLAASAAKNAYRAKTAQKKVDRFRAEMNQAFKGTKYDTSRSSRHKSNNKKKSNGKRG